MDAPVLVVAALVAAAVALLLPSTSAAARLGSAPGTSGLEGWRDRLGAAVGTPGTGRTAPLPAAVATGLAVALVTGLLPGLAAAAVAGVLARRLAAGLAARHRDRQRRQAVEACGVIADELRSGRAAHEALRAASGPGDNQLAATLRRAASTAALGGDVAAVLEHGPADSPLAPTLRRLAICWRVSERTGSGLASAAGALAGALQTQERQRREVTAELAGPRATARLLAVLPLFGLALGAALGAHPLAVLLHSALGGALLLVGVLLDLGGLAWTDRILRRADESSR